jgi:hypothetical protein
MPVERVREAGLTGASTADHEPTDDDMSPETLIREDGARDADEAAKAIRRLGPEHCRRGRHRRRQWAG